MLPLTCRTSWGQRVFGLVVLAVCVATAVALATTGGAPTLTWAFIAFFGLAAAWATAANFTESWHFDEDGVLHRRAVLDRIGRPAERRASWDDILRATEQNGRTWFLEVEGQGRWVLDHVDDHDILRTLFETQGVPVRRKDRPKLLGSSRAEPPR